MEQDLRIEADSAALVELKEALYDAVKDVSLQENDFDLREDTQVKFGEHGEAFLVAIIVALGGAALTREVFTTIRRWMKHREIMGSLDVVKFYLEDANGSRSVTLEKLMESISVARKQS